jgi:hypothetical protein
MTVKHAQVDSGRKRSRSGSSKEPTPPTGTDFKLDDLSHDSRGSVASSEDMSLDETVKLELVKPDSIKSEELMLRSASPEAEPPLKKLATSAIKAHANVEKSVVANPVQSIGANQAGQNILAKIIKRYLNDLVC